jgi:hypothetical protein
MHAHTHTQRARGGREKKEREREAEEYLGLAGFVDAVPAEEMSARRGGGELARLEAQPADGRLLVVALGLPRLDGLGLFVQPLLLLVLDVALLARVARTGSAGVSGGVLADPHEALDAQLGKDHQAQHMVLQSRLCNLPVEDLQWRRGVNDTHIHLCEHAIRSPLSDHTHAEQTRMHAVRVRLGDGSGVRIRCQWPVWRCGSTRLRERER